MTCKKCDSDYKLHIQKIKHDEQMEQLIDKFTRLRRDIAYFQFSLTGDRTYMDKFEFEFRNGEW